ncbi:MAG TPA: branched-chain amino acid ABC transporter permease [Actinomycetota bacterium]|nr:branched-chain amino acid ABC transporter permease [Actinomycetota bacterium]
MLPYLVIGVVSGVVYGLAALGLVLIYKGSRIFNFAQGEFGTVAMYILYFLVSLQGMNYFLALIFALIVGAILGVLTERLVVRPLHSSPRSIGLVGTAGVALLLVGLQLLIAGPLPRGVEGALEGRGPTLAGFTVSRQSLLTIVVLAVVATLSALFFKKTPLGLAILANSQDSTAAKLNGVNVNRISAFTWGLAGVLGALTGAVLAPDVPFYPGYMTTVMLIPAFTAAIVGGMTSLVGAFVAGQIIGLVEAMGQFFIAKTPALAKVPEGSAVLIFIVLVVALLFRPTGLFGKEA